MGIYMYMYVYLEPTVVALVLLSYPLATLKACEIDVMDTSVLYMYAGSATYMYHNSLFSVDDLMEYYTQKVENFKR